jgi:hypothetical protein
LRPEGAIKGLDGLVGNRRAGGKNLPKGWMTGNRKAGYLPVDTKKNMETWLPFFGMPLAVWNLLVGRGEGMFGKRRIEND